MKGKKLWYMLVLQRIGHRAQCACSSGGLRDLGEGLRSTKIATEERIAIVAEIRRMLLENGKDYDQKSIAYLHQLVPILAQQIQQPLPWYMVALVQMATYAKTDGCMQVLIEGGEDLKGSQMNDQEQVLIVGEIDRMIREDSRHYRANSIQYLIAIRNQIDAEY